MAGSSEIKAPICPVCEEQMTVAGKLKRLVELPDRRSYECRSCAVITWFSVDHVEYDSAETQIGRLAFSPWRKR